MNNIAARMVYENSKAAAQRALPNFDESRYKLTQSFLRVEQPLVANKSNFLFPVMVNQAAPQIYNTEQRLNLQDSFVISQIMFYLAQPSSTTDDTFKPLLYANPYYFTDENTARTIDAVYNGSLSITVNQSVLITAWDVLRHKNIPQTQQTAAWGAGSPIDEYNGAQDGFYPVEPNIVLVGSKNNVIQFQLPQGLAAAPANARIGLWFRGILVQNSTVVN